MLASQTFAESKVTGACILENEKPPTVLSNLNQKGF